MKREKPAERPEQPRKEKWVPPDIRTGNLYELDNAMACTKLAKACAPANAS